jgi:hypothetical protein
MPQVKVWNDNVHPYSEVFKGDKLHIPAKSFIKMDREEAIQFRGTYNSPVRDADGNDLPEGFKMIRIEPLSAEDLLAPEAQVKVDELVCLACAYKATNKTDLAEHTKTHAGQLVVDEDAEAELKARKKAKAG